MLARDLAACADGPRLAVAYDTATRVGTIRLEAQALRCAPAAGDLAPVVPVGKALAAYRNAVAQSADRRIATFRTSVAWGACELVLVGQIPPDGSTLAVEPAGCARY